MAMVAGELGEDGVGEDFGDEAHALEVGDAVAVRGGDAGGLLAAVLEGVEAPVGEAGGVGVVVDGHDAAFFAEFVEGGGVVLHFRLTYYVTHAVTTSAASCVGRVAS